MTVPNRDRAIALRRALWTVKAIAAELDVSPATVSVYVRQGLDDRERAEIQAAIYAQRERSAPRVELTCEWCGDTFERTESYLRAHRDDKHRFCGTRCKAEWYWHARRVELQALHDDIRRAMGAQGLVSPDKAGPLANWSPAAVRRLAKLPLERREFGGRVRLGVNARKVLEVSQDKHARRKLNKPLAALNGTEHVGRPRAPISVEDLATLVDLHRQGWGWRRLAGWLNDRHPDASPLAHMTVRAAVLDELASLASPV